MRLKRLTAILLCLCMALTLLPTAALAADEGQTIYVGGVELTTTAENPTVYARTVGGAVTTGGASATDYNIKWDGSTLTLSGADIQGTHGFSYTASASAAIYRTGGLEIELLDENKVSNPGGESGIYHSFGIYAEGGLTISGSGSLAASGGKGTAGSYGIYTDWGRVTVSGGGKVTATGGEAKYYSYGIYADGGITVQSGSITAEGGAAENASYGIYVTRETLAISGGTVHATGGEVSGEYAYSFGIFTLCDITISGGTVHATGGSATGSYAESCGIYVTRGDLTISGGTVNATGGTATGSCGIYATMGVTISGGEVTAEGATQAVRIYSRGSVTVDPAEGQQIAVTAGTDENNAQKISGSPFTGEAEINENTTIGEDSTALVFEAKYFHSIAGKAGDPDPDDPNIYVGGEGLTGSADTPAYALTDESGNVTTKGASATDYTIMWDGETLTLSGADIQGAYGFRYNTASASAAIYRTGGLEIALLGANTVSNPGGETNNYGIYVYGDLTISGSGSLAASGGEGSTGSYGIYAHNGDIAVSGGTVETTAGDAAYYSYGIYAFNGDIAVTDGTVNATGGAASFSHGIHATDDINISGGRVTATGGAAEHSCGIDASAIDISGGTVNATGGPATGDSLSFGINAENVTVSDGTATATGGSATGNSLSFGINAENVTISGGTVHATGGEVSGEYAYSYGIYVTLHGLTISGGEVTAEGATQAVRSFMGAVTVAPAEDQQIAVRAGTDADNAVKITDSPFTEEKEISGSISSAQYFHSIAEAAEGPGSGEPNPNIYVGSVGLTGSKDTPAYALTNGGTVTKDGATADNYNIMWDGETLALKNAAIRGGHQFRPGESAAIYYSGQDDITLKLSGNNTVTGPGGGDTEVSCGVYADGNLTIDGDGTLNVSGGEVSANDAYSYGIFTPCDITISGGTVTAEGGTASTTGTGYAESFGISVRDLTVSGGSVNATGGTASATGPNGKAYSGGIDAYYNITISGGTVNADGGTASATGPNGEAYSRGFYAAGITISDGEVTATGGTASAAGTDGKAYSRGIYVDMEATISGGIVNADGGKVTFTGSEGYAESCGISVRDLTVSGGTVNATGGTATGGSEESYGLSLPGTFTISGGTVTIAGKTASFDQSKSVLPNLSVLIAPQPKTQIRVQSGPNQGNAAEIKGSPFQEETEITGLASAAGVAYFKSAAEPARYSVTLHPNGGTIAGGKDVTSYLCGTGASLPGAGDVTRSGYRFAGWYADEALTDGPYTQISAADAGDMAFYARWVRRSSGGGGSSSRPTGPSTGHSDGWTDIREEIGSAEDGDTVTIDMNGETEVPAEIFEEIAGKDITVELDMGGGVTWTVDGRDVPEDTDLSDLDLGVDMDTSGISVDVINTVTGEYGAVQVSLDHDGAFGFALTLTAPLGRENAGYWANLYHYDEGEEALTFETSARIAADGSAALRMTHASQYAIVIDEKSHALPFEDVGTDAWYSDAVAYVYRNGLMSGTSGSTFSPDAAITRAQLVTILWRMAGSPQVNGLMDFDDVSQDAYYTEAVRWAASEGIAGGYGNGLFGSDDPITREQMAAILYRFAQHMGYDVSIGEDTNILSYTDALDVSGYAVAALQWACGAGIIRGTGDGSTLTPQGGATRAQAAVILTRFCAQSQ